MKDLGCFGIGVDDNGIKTIVPLKVTCEPSTMDGVDFNMIISPIIKSKGELNEKS